MIVLLLGLLFGVDYLLNKSVFKWYFDRETTSDQNKNRFRKVVHFVAISLFVIATLRILDIDYTFYDKAIQRAPTDDGPPTYLTIRISTLVKALAAFMLANVVDLVLSEIIVQRYHHRAARAGESVTSEQAQQLDHDFSSLRPFLLMVAILFIDTDIGLSDYYFHVFKNAKQEVTRVLTVGHILQAITIFFAIRLGLKVLTGFILQGYYGRSQVDSGSQFAINRLLTYFIYLIGVLLIIQAMGFDLVVIWTGAAALLVGIGIGLQQTFNDLICGVIILFERSVKVGDVVELAGHQVGTVRKIGARTSVVETRDDIIIFVPNSKLIGENVTNWSQVRRIARFHVQVGVAYGSDAELVKKTLLEVATKHPRVLKNPGPSVRLLSFGDSSLDFDLLFWSRDFLRIEDVKSDVRFAIDDAFRKNKIEIPFPQRDIWVRSTPVPGPGFEEE